MGRKTSDGCTIITNREEQVVKVIRSCEPRPLSVRQRAKNCIRKCRDIITTLFFSGCPFTHSWVKGVYGFRIWKGKSLTYYSYKRKCKKLGKRPPFTKPERIASDCIEHIQLPSYLSSHIPDGENVGLDKEEYGKLSLKYKTKFHDKQTEFYNRIKGGESVSSIFAEVVGKETRGVSDDNEKVYVEEEDKE